MGHGNDGKHNHNDARFVEILSKIFMMQTAFFFKTESSGGIWFIVEPLLFGKKQGAKIKE